MRYAYAGIGSRKTPESVLSDMTMLARWLSPRFLLRSGHAPGADAAFESGVAAANREIWLPWERFGGSLSRRVAGRAALEFTAQFHPAWHMCSRAARQLHARNAHIMFGERLDDPVDFVICWTPGGQRSGGTGQALRMADVHHIPVFDLALMPVTQVVAAIRKLEGAILIRERK